MTALSKYFSIEEMTVSQTASRLSLDNSVPPGVWPTLVKTALQLDIIRELLGHVITVTSGYRSEALNHEIGGAPVSDHCRGWAVDFICPGFGSPREVCGKLLEAKVQFRQLIFEYTWVHISFGPPLSKLVNRVLTRNGSGYAVGILLQRKPLAG